MITKSDEGKKVFVQVEGQWIECKVTKYIGENELNKGRQLVEVHSSYFGHEIFDASDLYTSIPRTYPKWMHEEAKKYGVTAERIYDENMAFLQNEGYFETASRVIECETFDFWMKLALEKEPFRIREPWQKSDLGYGL